MKVYNINENKKIRKMKKDQTSTTHVVNSFLEITRARFPFLKTPITIVTLRNVNKEFCCDTFKIFGDSVIGSLVEDDVLTIVNMRTGLRFEATRVEFANDSCIVTLKSGSRRFLTKDGDLQYGEILQGGFVGVDRKDGVNTQVFKDVKGNISTKTFVTTDGTVLAGEIRDNDEGIYVAERMTSNRAYKKVYYDITGKELRTKEDLEKARIIHAISKNSNIDFSNVPTEYYLDYKFYNSVLDAIKRRFYDLADELGNNAADPNYRKLYSKFNATLHLVQQAREDSKKALVDNERVIKGV